MGIFNSCLLASDLDGTLIYGDIIPKRNIEAIEFFTSEGGIFSVATGRSPSAVDGVFKHFKNIGPSVFTNGSVIFDYSKKQILRQSFMTKKCNTALNEILKYDINVGVQVHNNGKVFVPVMTDNIKMHLEYEDIKHIDCSVEDAMNLPINKIMYFIDEQDRVDEITDKLRLLDLECDFVISSATFHNVFCRMIEQCPKNITKVTGIDFLLNKFHIDKGNFFAIGDYYNDVTMIKSADVSACVAESPDEVKVLADVVCGTAKNGAVADFIEYLSKK